VLADLVASLNARLGEGGYFLKVDLLAGQLDLSGLGLPVDEPPGGLAPRAATVLSETDPGGLPHAVRKKGRR